MRYLFAVFVIMFQFIHSSYGSDQQRMVDTVTRKALSAVHWFNNKSQSVITDIQKKHGTKQNRLYAPEVRTFTGEQALILREVEKIDLEKIFPYIPPLFLVLSSCAVAADFSLVPMCFLVAVGIVNVAISFNRKNETKSLREWEKVTAALSLVLMVIGGIKYQMNSVD